MTIREPNVRKELIGIAIFCLAFVCLHWIAADILQIAGDEGIYLEGGRRIAMGEQPYRDFFALTGPLTFWIQGILAYLGGMKLTIMRLPVILDAAFLAWAVYWFTSRYTIAAYSAGAAFAFVVYESQIRMLAVNHRWDSGALATAALVAAMAAERSGRRGIWALSGVVAAAAAWATPSMIILALPLFWWSTRKHPAGAIAFLAGGAIASTAAALYLQRHRALIPMIHSLRWTGVNYTAPNRVPYGFVLMGTQTETAGWEHVLWKVALSVPAILPPIAIAGWVWFRSAARKWDEVSEIPPLMACAAALTLAAWPRWTSDTLLHTMALSWFLCAFLLYRLTTPRQRFWVCGVILVVAAGSWLPKLAAPFNSPQRETRVGSLRDANNEGELLETLERWIGPGDSLFSYPYLPAAYYYLNTRNPTTYSFLQPGMMSAEDERKAIEQLRADPPQWVIYEKFPTALVLRIWPGTDPTRIPMDAMNGFLRDHYRDVDAVAHDGNRLVVMERMPASR